MKRKTGGQENLSALFRDVVKQHKFYIMYYTIKSVKMKG